ncbi:hypothetical protein BJ546DRAFT_271995 [Cryomyces antarcticus]
MECGLSAESVETRENAQEFSRSCSEQHTQSISSADRSIERAVARSVFPSDRKCPTATDDASLDWYHHWLQERIEQLPGAVTKRIRSFPAVFCKVAVLTKSKCSINEIAASLPRSDMLETPDTDDDRRLLTCVVFALLGWQTMLYEPALGIAPPQQLAVADVLDGFSSQALTSLKQDCFQARRSLPDFLLGFGLMLCFCTAILRSVWLTSSPTMALATEV